MLERSAITTLQVRFVELKVIKQASMTLIIKIVRVAFASGA
jgi:hypothetical protein